MEYHADTGFMPTPKKSEGTPRGRPPKPTNARKDVVLRVLLTKKQRALLAAAAAKEDLDLSTWVRTVALRAAEKKTSD